MLLKFKRDFIGNLFALESQRSIAWKCHNLLFGELTMYVLRNGVCASKALETWVTRQTYLLGSSININKNMRLAFYCLDMKEATSRFKLAWKLSVWSWWATWHFRFVFFQDNCSNSFEIVVCLKRWNHRTIHSIDLYFAQILAIL